MRSMWLLGTTTTPRSTGSTGAEGTAVHRGGLCGRRAGRWAGVAVRGVAGGRDEPRGGTAPGGGGTAGPAVPGCLRLHRRRDEPVARAVPATAAGNRRGIPHRRATAPVRGGARRPGARDRAARCECPADPGRGDASDGAAGAGRGGDRRHPLRARRPLRRGSGPGDPAGGRAAGARPVPPCRRLPPRGPAHRGGVARRPAGSTAGGGTDRARRPAPGVPPGEPVASVADRRRAAASGAAAVGSRPGRDPDLPPRPGLSRPADRLGVRRRIPPRPRPAAPRSITAQLAGRARLAHAGLHRHRPLPPPRHIVASVRSMLTAPA